MVASKNEKVVPLRGDPVAYVHGAVSREHQVAVTPSSSPVAKAEAGVVPGVDLSDVPKLILLAGRGKTGKTTAIRWMSERAVAAGRPLLMADLDPTNASLSAYFSGVHQPEDRGDPVGALRWLEGFAGHVIEHRQTAGVDLGGGDTTLLRLVDEFPNLAQLADEASVAVVLLYFIGPQLDDLAPLAAMAQREFKPRGMGIVMNEAAGEVGSTREQAFARVHAHDIFRDAVSRGAVPVWMPKLFNADAIEARRLNFIAARDGATGAADAPLNLLDRARVRVWLDTMERQFSGIASWLP